jgi:stearoyl-CoA desaturase (delta-9 desaturase)
MHIGWMLLISVVVMQLSVFYTTIFLHRSLSHKGLRLHPVVRNIMHLHLILFTGIIPREWAAVHRKHHHYSDKEGDPHSPYLLGLWKVFWLNAIYYRREANNKETVEKYTKDYEPDLIDKIPFGGFGALFGLAIFTLAFGWVWGPVLFIGQGWGYIILNATINSVCHMIGYKNFDNKATNIQWVALLTGGEGLHNNHHQYPASPKLAMKGGEFDPAWPVIRLLEVMRLAEVTKPKKPLAKAG